jgi:citrate synthase
MALMKVEGKAPTTELCYGNETSVFMRDHDLANEIMGHMSFTQTIYLMLFGRKPGDGESKVFDAVLVSLMEHGLTPQAISARLIALCSPDSIQGAIAAGILGVGSRFAGTMEGTVPYLKEIIAAGDNGPGKARELVKGLRAAKKALPGFGHAQHKPEDPRAQRLLEIARESGVAGPHTAALLVLSQAVDETFGKHLPINVTGAIGAVLTDMGVNPAILRGFAVLSRAAGLLAHINEEQSRPAAAYISALAEDGVAYTGRKG